MAVSANRLELLQIADAVAREKVIDKQIVIDTNDDSSAALAAAEVKGNDWYHCDPGPQQRSVV